MAGRLEKLLMRVELIDKVTAPANKISASIKNIHKTAEAGFIGIGKGVAGIFGAGLAFNSLTAGAREMKAALADVKSLGVASDALAKLEKRAIAFSIAYGESAVDFIRSSYDIWGALPGLAGDELASFTEAGGLLAKATKADATMVSEFMGTMYNIFEKQANKIGRATWVEMMAGQIAKAVDIFKTSGKGMSEAFTNLGATAISRPMEEQVAVLGKLQAVMKGANAGTAYKSFVMGISKAEKELGVALTDSQGNMLGVVEILRKIQGRVNGMGDAKVNAMLGKAFGEPAVAMIANLIGHIDSLESDIATIGATPGMEDLKWMVEQMVDPYQQMTQANTALRLSFGKLINWALEPFYVAAAKHQATLAKWIDKYPHLFGAIAKLTIFVMSFTAIIGLLAVAKGVVIIAAAGLSAGMMILKMVMMPFGPILKALRYAWLIFNIQLAAGAGLIPALRVAMAAFTKSLLIHSGALRAARMATFLWTASLGFARAAVLATAIRFPWLITGLTAMRAGFMTAALGARAFAMALLANPITWIVLGVVALVAGLVMLVKHWDAVSAAGAAAIDWLVGKWQAFRAIIEDNPVLKFIFQPLLLAADFVGFLISNLNKIPEWFTTFKNWLSGMDVFGAIISPVKWLLEQLKLIPGLNLNIGNVDLPTQATQASPEAAQKFAQLSQPVGLQGAINAGTEIGLKTNYVEQRVKQTYEPAAVPNISPLIQPVKQSVEPAPVAKVSVLAQPVNPILGDVKAKTPSPIAQPIEPVLLPVKNVSFDPIKMPVDAQIVNAVKVPDSIARAEAANDSIQREREALAPAPVAPVKNVPTGGLQQQFNNSYSNRNTTIGSLNVTTNQQVNGYSLADQLRMAGG